MQKVLVFTDIHLVPEGQTIIDLDPAARFQQGLEHALARHPDAALVVITGDLAHHGSAAEYARLHRILENCPLPVQLMIGNHDSRSTFRAVFPQAPIDPNGFVQAVWTFGTHTLLCLDTVDETGPIEHAGYLCANRLDWLDAALRDAKDQSVTIFMHHPPMRTGFAAMDRIGLRNRQDFRAVLSRHNNVSQIIAGHVHRTISASTAGRPVAIFKSTCHQMPMALNHADEHVSVDEPGAYGLLLLDQDGIVVLPEDFGLATAGVLADARPLSHPA